MNAEPELEIIEEYELMGRRRYRIRVKNTILVINVEAGSREEALKKARSILKELSADKVIEELRSL